MSLQKQTNANLKYYTKSSENKKYYENDYKSLNKLGEFDLTNDIRERKRKEWWARLKYRLLKLINTKHGLINADRKPLPQEKINDNYFSSVFNPPKVRKNHKSIEAEPDLLSILEQFKTYYAKKDKPKKKVRIRNEDLQMLTNKSFKSEGKLLLIYFLDSDKTLKLADLQVNTLESKER